MKYEVHVTPGAEEDLVEIHGYVARCDSPVNADRLIDKLEKLCSSLASRPERGHVPMELERIGTLQFREVHLKPYRVVYQTIQRAVHVYGILDGRRDMQEILSRR